MAGIVPASDIDVCLISEAMRGNQVLRDPVGELRTSHAAPCDPVNIRPFCAKCNSLTG